MTPAVIRVPESYTGAAFIFVDAGSGDNAIIISPGAAATIAPADLDAQAGADRAGGGLRHPARAAARRRPPRARDRPRGRSDDDPEPGPRRGPARRPPRALRLRHPERDRGVGADRPAGGQPRRGARAAADRLIARGAGAAVITLGAQGALFHGHAPLGARARGQGRRRSSRRRARATPSTAASPPASPAGMDPVAAVRLGCAVAGISVTRAGTAPSMPTAAEVEAVLARD